VPWAEPEHFFAMYVRSHTRYDILISGVTLAYVQHTWAPALRRLFAKPVWRWLFGAFGAVWFPVLMYPPFLKPSFYLFRTLSYGTFTTFMYVPWILVLVNSNGWIARFLSHRVFLVVATLGYGIYLVHIPIIEHVFLSSGGWFIAHHVSGISMWWTFFVGTITLSIALAYVLHLVVEKPALYLRDRFAR
jgi:peptidoglycan/LPS O-acetylase OafA/YrhL